MKRMNVRFYVIDNEGHVSWDGDKDTPEHFKTEANAFARAREIAESDPGKAVFVTRAIEAVIAPVGKVERLGIQVPTQTK